MINQTENILCLRAVLWRKDDLNTDPELKRVLAFFDISFVSTLMFSTINGCFINNFRDTTQWLHIKLIIIS